MQHSKLTALEELVTLRDERVAALERNSATIEALHKHNERLHGEICGLEMAIKTLGDREPKVEMIDAAEGGKYVNMGLTDAIFAIVQLAGMPPGLSGSQIVGFLMAGGFKSEAKDLYTSAYGVAMGLVKQGRIQEGEKDGKRTFLRIP